jgi:hypothetical protein
MRAGTAVGHYFRILALVSLLWMPVSILMGRGVSIDATFILLFWVGQGLLRRRERARKIAIAFCGFCVTIAIVLLVQAIVSPIGPAFRMRGGSVTATVAIFESGRFLMFFLPPLVLLLLPSTRLAYRGESASLATSYSWTRVHTAAHVLGAALLIALGLLHEHSIGRTSVSRTLTAMIYGQTAQGVSVVSVFRDEDSNTDLFITSWVLGEHSSAGYEGNSWTPGSGSLGFPGERSPVLLIGPHEIQPLDPRPARYLRGVDSVAEPIKQANILIVRSDGRVIRVQRRISLQTLRIAENAIRGSKDFDEVQQKLETILPPLASR